MSRKKNQQGQFDESGQPVESAPMQATERKERSTRLWAIHALRSDGQSWDVVAEGLTKQGCIKTLHGSMMLLRRLYVKVRLVKTVIGEEMDL